MTGFVKVDLIGGGRVGADARFGNGDEGIDDGVPFWNAEKRPKLIMVRILRFSETVESPKIWFLRIVQIIEPKNITNHISHSRLLSFDFVGLYFSFL